MLDVSEDLVRKKRKDDGEVTLWPSVEVNVVKDDQGVGHASTKSRRLSTHEVYCEGLYERGLLKMKEKEARSKERQEREDLSDDEEVNFQGETSSPRISPYSRARKSSLTVEDRLLEAGKVSKSNMRELRRVSVANELEQCTFKPDIHVYKAKGKGKGKDSNSMPTFRKAKDSHSEQGEEGGGEEWARRSSGKHGTVDAVQQQKDKEEVYNRLWEESRSKQVKEKQAEKPTWKRRESVMMDGNPLSPFALNLRTPTRLRRAKGKGSRKKAKGDEQLNNEWINHLYKDASNRRKIQRSREDEIDQQILDQTSCYSMTNHSFNIIMKTVSRQTMYVLDKAFPDSDHIQQEGFLDLVTAFGILPPLEKLGVRYLKYLPEEEQLVERLWNILSIEVTEQQQGEEGSQEKTVVPKVAMHDFMILVECCILNGNIKLEMKLLFHDKRNRENMKFWKVLESVSEMKLVNKQAYSNLKNVSDSNDEGEASVNKRKASKTNKKSFLQFYKAQLFHTRNVEAKTRELSAKLDAEEQTLCTFAPKLNPYYQVDSKSRGKIAKRRVSIVEHMPDHVSQESSGKDKQMQGGSSKSLHKSKMREGKNQVTFSVLKYPNGYNKHLDRMAPYDEVGSGCYHYTAEQKKECMMHQIVFYMEFRFRGKFVSIPVHLFDNPRKISLVVAKHLEMPKEAFSKLLTIVKIKMAENDCMECYEDAAEDRFPFTYSYAEQFEKARGLQKPLKFLYSVFDEASPRASYAGLAEKGMGSLQEEEEEPMAVEWTEEGQRDSFYNRSTNRERAAYSKERDHSKYPSYLSSYARKSAQRVKAKKNKEAEKSRKANNSYGENLSHQNAESQISRYILDGLSPENKPRGLRSRGYDRRSIASRREELQAALLTEPPAASREHLMRAMEDLWL